MKQIVVRSIILVAALVAGAQALHAYGGDCPIHPDSGTYKTGKTAIIGGTLAWEYYCYRGHEFWAR